MHRTIFLWRHAKSSWGDPSLPDAERSLAPRGERAAERMAQHIAERSREFAPLLVLASPARRVQQTLAALRPALGNAVPIETEPDLYLASAETLLERLRRLDDRVGAVLVVGHEPGLRNLALELARAEHSRAWRRLVEKFPTAALAELSIDLAVWRALEPSHARLVDFTRPRDLMTA